MVKSPHSGWHAKLLIGCGVGSISFHLSGGSVAAANIVGDSACSFFLLFFWALPSSYLLSFSARLVVWLFELLYMHCNKTNDILIARIIKEFKKEVPTTMIGDGIHDTPALATNLFGINNAS
ncbi:hypothetical protein V6N12_048209 [Hibiscus sabdariffa]|uniref:Uncharacterized protein n=1 Tax=Hibiscus sabdariffa TaxID=183260 RepID=A0ABR2EGM0_9ROSI